jgi:hypothetical protein
MKRSPVPLLSLVLSALAVGCAGPPIPAPIQGEPVCADFELGAARTKMAGSLRLPVRLRILDGETVMMRTILNGKRSAGDAPARSFIPDDNAVFTVEWAQCPNERAPSPVADDHAKANPPKLAPPESGAYECGEATVYKTDQITTKKGDVASHAIAFVPPPNPECWVSDAKPAPPAPASASAAAPAAPAEAAPAAKAAGVGDRGAPAADAGATKDDKVKDTKGDKAKDAKSDKAKETPKK